jgi:hypothetical protein
MSAVINYIIPLVLFVLLASPSMFKIVRNILGSWVASSDGLASPAGLVVHGLVYIAIVGFIMTKTNKKSQYSLQ